MLDRERGGNPDLNGFNLCICFAVEQVYCVRVADSFFTFDDGRKCDAIAVENEVWVNEIEAFTCRFRNDLCCG